MIPFKNRFHGHSSLRYVYKNGLAVRSRLMTMKSTANPHRPDSRLAVVVSKKVIKSAVKRNRIRRRVYEYLRQQLESTKPSHDIVIIVSSSELLTIPQKELEESI
jgi:ribonuclease P protein component